MGNISITLALIGGAALFSNLATADRECSSNVSSSYLWRVSDARFDGADPSVSDGRAVVAVSSESIPAHSPPIIDSDESKYSGSRQYCFTSLSLPQSNMDFAYEDDH